MPKSKRDKKVSLTKTTKKGKELKQNLVENIRKHLEEFDNLYVFTVDNMRNGPLKEVREDWKGSRFFYAKKKVMAVALGRNQASEAQKNIHKLSKHLTGQCGLLFTNKPKDYVIEWFNNFSKMDYAKSGFLATRTVKLPAGPLPDFSHALEPHLRSLGLPTRLEKGVIVLREEYTVCTEGTRLKPEEASILKLLGEQMAEFKMSLVCMWSKDGSFEKFKTQKHLIKMTQSLDEVESKKKNKKKKEKSKKLNKDTLDHENKTNPLPPDNEIITPMSNLRTSESEVDQEIEIHEEKNKTPKKSNTTKKARTKRSSPELTSDTPMDEDVVEDLKDPTSPHFGKSNPRRSMRTPKPIKRTPEQSKHSVKKLTVTASKVQKSTPKGTPKKSKL